MQSRYLSASLVRPWSSIPAPRSALPYPAPTALCLQARTFSTTQPLLKHRLPRSTTRLISKIESTDVRNKAMREAWRQQQGTEAQALEERKLYLDLGLRPKKASMKPDTSSPEYPKYQQALYEAHESPKSKKAKLAKSRLQRILRRMQKALPSVARESRTARELVKPGVEMDRWKQRASDRLGRKRKDMLEAEKADIGLRIKALTRPSLLPAEAIEKLIHQLEERIPLERWNPPSINWAVVKAAKTATIRPQDDLSKPTTGRARWRKRRKEAMEQQKDEEKRKDIAGQWQAELDGWESRWSDLKTQLQICKTEVAGRESLPQKALTPDISDDMPEGSRYGFQQNQDAGLSLDTLKARRDALLKLRQEKLQGLERRRTFIRLDEHIKQVKACLLEHMGSVIEKRIQQLHNISESIGSLKAFTATLPPEEAASSTEAKVQGASEEPRGQMSQPLAKVETLEEAAEKEDRPVPAKRITAGGAGQLAKAWREVSPQKDERTVQDEDEAVAEIDRNEWHASGWGWLGQEHVDETVAMRESEEGTKKHALSGDTPSARRSYKFATFRRLNLEHRFSRNDIRHYSTSPRPSLELDEKSPSEPAASSSAAAAESASSSSTSSTEPTLPHLTPSGSAHMVSVGSKAHTLRTAIAVGTVYFSNPTPLSLIRSNSLKKGDVLSVSRIAGIMAAKKCPDLVPLCHPIALTHVGVELKAVEIGQYGGVAVEAKVQCEGQTGVEMEALTSVMGAALSVVDMCKAVDKGMMVQDVRVVLKEGGRSGTWKEAAWKSVVGAG